MAVILIFDYQHRYEQAVGRLAEWFARAVCAIERISSTASKIALGQLPNFTAEKTSASA
jgi:hypothetical protein